MLVFISILPVPLVTNNPSTFDVPIPTLPSTIIPLVGAVIVPAYEDEPIITDPFTSKAFLGVKVLIPTLPVNLGSTVGGKAFI